MSTSYSWGSAPTIPLTISDSITKDSGSRYSGYLTISLGPLGGGSYFGYNITATVDGETKTIKDNLPNQWSDGAYSASWYISGSSYSSSVSISVSISSNSGRAGLSVGYTAYIGTYDDPATEPASVPTLSVYTAKLGGSVIVYTNRQSSSYKHTISYTVGSAKGTIASNVGASTTWSIPTSLIDKVTSAGTNCTITVVTKYGSSTIGTKTVTLTLYPPDGYTPTVQKGWATATYDNRGTAAASIAAAIKGFSKVKVTFNSAKVTGNYGATIQKFTVTYAGTTVTASSGVARTKIISELSASLICTVVDSRGNSTSETILLSLNDYAPPTITGASIYRCDGEMLPADAGEHIAAKATARCTALGGKNKVTLTAAYRAFSASSYSAEKAMSSGTAVMVTGNTVVSNAVSYVVRLTAKDSLGKTTTFEKLVPTRSVTFSLREGGKGAAFGKLAERDVLECQFPAEFNSGVTITGGVNITNGNTVKPLGTYIKEQAGNHLTALDIYPVGSIYISVNNTNPNKLFGGTWVQLKDRFLLGAGRTYAGGKTGGTASVTLTEAQMPSHNHGGTTAYDGEHSHGFPGNRSGGSGQTAEGKGASDSYYTLYTNDAGEHAHTISSAGQGQAHDNMPPYLVVYMWKRTK